MTIEEALSDLASALMAAHAAIESVGECSANLEAVLAVERAKSGVGPYPTEAGE